MIILGIDPGIGRLGYAFVEYDEKHANYKTLTFGCIEPSTKKLKEQRLVDIFNVLDEYIRQYNPTELAIERQFFNQNVKTATSVGQACGVVLLLAGLHQMNVSDYTPQAVKSSVTGYGKADKEQVLKMVRLLLKLHGDKILDDTADALALAICHGMNVKFKKLTA